jgi:hypothetical protein
LGPFGSFHGHPHMSNSGQRAVGSKTPGKGAAAAGRTKLLPYYCRIQETPGAPEDTRGNEEGHQKDRRAQKHHDEDRRAQRGDRERYQEDRREQRGDRSRPQGHMDPTKLGPGDSTSRTRGTGIGIITIAVYHPYYIIYSFNNNIYILRNALYTKNSAPWRQCRNS